MSYSSVHKALYKFWSGFADAGKEIPAYISGHVPKTADYPYITFDVVDNPPFSSIISTAIAWFKAESGENVNAKRAAFFDDVRREIPAQGRKILVDGGLLILYPNSATFLSYYDDAESENVVGARVSYEIQYYH